MEAEGLEPTRRSREVWGGTVIARGGEGRLRRQGGNISKAMKQDRE